MAMLLCNVPGLNIPYAILSAFKTFYYLYKFKELSRIFMANQGLRELLNKFKLQQLNNNIPLLNVKKIEQDKFKYVQGLNVFHIQVYSSFVYEPYPIIV